MPELPVSAPTGAPTRALTPTLCFSPSLIPQQSLWLINWLMDCSYNMNAIKSRLCNSCNFSESAMFSRRPPLSHHVHSVSFSKYQHLTGNNNDATNIKYQLFSAISCYHLPSKLVSCYHLQSKLSIELLLSSMCYPHLIQTSTMLLVNLRG